MDPGLVGGVIALGIVHGVLPDHGWPIAAAYALSRPQRWVRGTLAALVLGVGHLISSVALVVAYFWVSRFAAFAEGPWMKQLAGGLLIALGIYEYVGSGRDHHHHYDHNRDRDDHDHDRDRDHDHDHNRDHNHHDRDNHNHHNHDRDRADGGGPVEDAQNRPSDGSRVQSSGGDEGGNERGGNEGGGNEEDEREHDRRGLFALGTTALLLGFAHEEPIQVLAICAGTEFCLELMLVYSGAVIGAILAPTLALIAGYQRHGERIERYAPYLPTITALVLVSVGLGFLAGLF